METLKLIFQGGAIAVIVGFVQFLIQRKDTRNDRIKALEEKIDERMDTLEEKVDKGLEDREKKGSERFDIHEKKYDELKEFMIKHSESDEKRDAYMQCVGKGVMVLIHKDLLDEGKKFEERGAITRKERTDLKAMYMPYKALGGNGDGEEIYNFCSELKVVSEEEAAAMDKEILAKRKRRSTDKETA